MLSVLVPCLMLLLLEAKLQAKACGLTATVRPDRETFHFAPNSILKKNNVLGHKLIVWAVKSFVICHLDELITCIATPDRSEQFSFAKVINIPA
mgnify:CR=1 FL=1